MTYASEHQRLKPVLEAARKLDIATNPTPEAIFEAGNGAFQIWCTPDDHPSGWEGVSMTRCAFSKPCAYVASVRWGWEGERIVHLWLSSDAYELGDHLGAGRYALHNRPEDLTWAESKVHRLFQLAGVPIPPIVIED
ncbi:MAG: hypothetical protein H8D34_18785 [Chloroflexi bacterium]|nr:hypothetical protein [Chloroflexota bacterium]MBL7162895.1 hypothetical protein [Anaerolineales bacterium]